MVAGCSGSGTSREYSRSDGVYTLAGVCMPRASCGRTWLYSCGTAPRRAVAPAGSWRQAPPPPASACDACARAGRYVPGFARDPVARAQLRHRLLIPLIVKDKPQLLLHHTARSPRHVALLHAFFSEQECQECSRSVLSGMRPVCTPCMPRRAGREPARLPKDCPRRTRIIPNKTPDLQNCG